MLRPQAFIGTALSIGILAVTIGTAHAASREACEATRTTVRSQLEAACPCDTAESHANYVRCITAKLRALSACETGEGRVRTCGPVPRACVGNIRRTASRSACGKSGMITCCLPKQHDCAGDPTPGDGNAQGTCTGTQRPCDRVGDCLLSRCQISPTAERCALAGGKPGTGKDCTTACTP